MSDLNISDNDLINRIMRQICGVIADADSNTFLRLIGSISHMKVKSMYIFRCHLHRRPRLQLGISSQLLKLVQINADVSCYAILVYTLAKIGYHDEALNT